MRNLWEFAIKTSPPTHWVRSQALRLYGISSFIGLHSHDGEVCAAIAQSLRIS